MSEAILVAHGQDAPPTQNHGSHPIDGIFTTGAIQNNPCRYLSSLDAIGDHQCLWMDIPKIGLFGNAAPAITGPKTC